MGMTVRLAPAGPHPARTIGLRYRTRVWLPGAELTELADAGAPMPISPPSDAYELQTQVLDVSLHLVAAVGLL